jgi:hypothetical protein
MAEFILGSQAGEDALHSSDDSIEDSVRVATYRKVLLTPIRKDGGRLVSRLTEEELDILDDAADLFIQVAQSNTNTPDGRADLSAARAMKRGIRKIRS